MNKFQRLLKYTFSYVGGFFSTHPVTFITVCAGTLLGFVEALSVTDVLPLSSGASKQLEMILMQYLLSAFIFCLFAFCLESSPLKQKMPPFVSVPVYVIGGGLSYILASLVFASPEGKEITLYPVFRFYREMIGTTRTMLILFGVCTILLLMGIFFCYEKMEEVSFSAYLVHVFSGLFFAWITFGFLASGSASLTGIFTLLLWGDFEKIFFPLIVLLLGGYYILRCASCFTERPKEVNGFIYVLIRYVLLIMSLIAYVIIYIYMIKILVLREFPSNSVYAILTSLFVISMPIAYMSAGMKRRAAESEKGSSRDVLGNIARFLPVVFIPFIFLQFYTTWVRIAQYGLTVKRYFGVLFILFEIVFIVLYIVSLKKETFRLSLLLPVFAGFILFSSLLPFVNANGMSRLVQVSCINSYLQKKDAKEIGEHVKSRAAAAYEALRDEEKGGDYLKARFSEDDRKSLDLLIRRADADPETDHLEWTSWETEKNELDMNVSAYDRMQYAYLAASGTQNAKSGNADIKKTGLYINTAGNIPVYTSSEDLTKNDALQTFDLTDYAEQYLELSKKSENSLSDYEYQKAMQEIQTIRLSDSADFYVTEAEVRYRTDNDQIVEFLLQGYYLTK